MREVSQPFIVEVQSCWIELTKVFFLHLMAEFLLFLPLKKNLAS